MPSPEDYKLYTWKICYSGGDLTSEYYYSISKQQRLDLDPQHPRPHKLGAPISIHLIPRNSSRQIFRHTIPPGCYPVCNIKVHSQNGRIVGRWLRIGYNDKGKRTFTLVHCKTGEYEEGADNDGRL